MALGAVKQNEQAQRRNAAKAQDAIKLLSADHREVEALFNEFQKTKEDDSAKADIVQRICNALSEEEIFYPAAHEALSEKGDDLLDEAKVEHASIETLIEQLRDAKPGEDLYDAKVKVLSEYVTHHVREEEGELFPKVAKTDLNLDELGAELMERKAELMDEDEDLSGNRQMKE
jgi:hemerythrin superfamily protein